MLFILSPEHPIFSGTTNTTTINAEYAHETVPLTGLSFSFPGFEVGFSWNLTCDTRAVVYTLKYSS